MMGWPHPGDSTLDRARRVALAYRGELAKINPDFVELMDRQLAAQGESWVLPELVTVDEDAWIPLKQAATLVGRTPDAIRKWIKRGRLGERRDPRGRLLVHTADVLRLQRDDRLARMARAA